MYVNVTGLLGTIAALVFLLGTVYLIVRAGDSINTVSTDDADMTGTYFGDEQR